MVAPEINLGEDYSESGENNELIKIIVSIK